MTFGGTPCPARKRCAQQRPLFYFSRGGRIEKMVIRADRDIRLQVFVDVLDIINNLGFRKVAIQTEKGGDGGP